MQQNQFITAIEMLAEEKGLSKEIIVETVEMALAAAYKKDYGDKDQEVRVVLSGDSIEPQVFVSRTVVPDGEVENEFLQIGLTDAKKIDKKAVVGTEDEPYAVEQEEHAEGFGRVAAQTAKQVIIQRLREAERELIFTEYSDKVDTVLNGTVQRVDGSTVYVDLGKANGVLFPNEQIPNERYYIGQRLKVYLVRVEQSARGPQLILSRTHIGMVRHLFELEVPEIESGAVHIRAIAREAGVRTKIAVESTAEGVDAVGTFVGGRGARVQAVMSELGEEKIDIILFSSDPSTFIINALSPTKVINVELNETEQKATVKVPEDQLSLAIGKQGQNVRLAAKLTGWNIDITSADENNIDAGEAEAAEPTKPKKRVDLEGSLIDAVNSQTDEEIAAEEAAALPVNETVADAKIEAEVEEGVEATEEADADSGEEANDGTSEEVVDEDAEPAEESKK